MELKKEYSFEGEFYQEFLDIDGKEYEHVGFRSFDGKFEELLNFLADNVELPIKVELKITLKDEAKLKTQE